MAVLTYIPKPLVPKFRMTPKEEKIIDGVLLLKSICNKESAPEEARNSFTLFVSYFEDKLKKIRRSTSVASRIFCKCRI